MSDKLNAIAKKMIIHRKDVGLVQVDNQMEMIDALNAIKENTTPETGPETPEQVIVDFSSVNEKLDALIEEVKKKDQSQYDLQIDPVTREKLRGDKGDKGDSVKPSKEEILSIVREIAPDFTPSEDDLKLLMESMLPTIPEIAPESPEMTRDKLELLEGDERLDVKAIKGLESISEDILTKARGFIPSRSGGGVTSVISSDGSVEVTPSMAKGKGVVDLKVTSTGGSGVPATTVVSETSYSQSPVVGVGTKYARDDHSHGTPALPTKADIGLGNVVNLDTSTTTNITDSLNKRFVTDAQQTVINNQTGVNSGDNSPNTLYSGLATSKEDAITGTTSADFWSGAKTFINFATTVRATVLTGLSLVSTTVISATDSILVALGSLQAQITALTSVVSGKQATLVSGSNIRTVNGNTLLGSTDLVISGGVSDGDKGDITVSGTGATWTIDAGAVTLAKQADMATASLVYRKTAGSGAPEVNTLATLKTDLGLSNTNSGDQTSIVGITGTKAQFDTAVTDGNIMYIGDAPTAHTHVIADVTGLQTALDNKLDDTQFVGLLKITVGTSTPATPTTGDLWVDTN